jgi:hypothetical protein
MLPEKAFQRKLFGNSPATLEGGSGGGSSGPTSSTTQTSNIPEYARPYVETMLGATQQQLFNTKQTPGTTNAEGVTTPGSTEITGVKPYVPFSQNPNDYVAGFSPMQQQSQQGVAGMQVPGEFNAATNMTGTAGLGALGTTQQAGGYGGMGMGYGAMGAQQGLGFGQQAQDPNAVQGFMNPYLQASLQPQLAEMERQYGISGAQQQSGATKSGAFGGSREALMAAENQRNKNTAMNQAIGQGYNTAFNNAQQQMAQAAQLGMQGAGMGMQGAGLGLQGIGAQQAGYGQLGQMGGQLASIGGQKLQAQQGIYGLQNQMGAQQQAQEQQKINQQIQDYAVAQQYPQQQLSFMNAMLRGLPMQAGTTQMYQAPPSAISQIGGLGTAGIAGLGLYNTMNK